MDRVADKIVSGLETASRNLEARVVAQGHLNARKREIDTALVSVGLLGPAAEGGRDYSDYVCRVEPGDIWGTVSAICTRLEERRRCRRKTLRRLFRAVDAAGRGQVDKKCVLKFVTHGRPPLFMPKCTRALLHGRRYMDVLREMSAPHHDGRVTSQQFVEWAMARWLPPLPSTKAAPVSYTHLTLPTTPYV